MRTRSSSAARGVGGFAALLLGSVGGEVAAHATRPTVIVRGQGHPRGPVIVGVDGSERGESALEYGFDYAARHGLEVQALHVYSVPRADPALPHAPRGQRLASRGSRQGRAGSPRPVGR